MNVSIGSKTRPYRTVSFNDRLNEVELIEQRLLPHQFKTVKTGTYRATARAITDMVVRGAGAIGATAAYGFAQGINAFRGSNLRKFEVHLEMVFQVLKNARPTAVDPLNALNQIRKQLPQGATVVAQQAKAIELAQAFAEENVRDCIGIGVVGAGLIRSGCRVLTHCNAGWLAFVDIGSVTAPIYAAHRAGTKFHVFCSETRPRSQGSTLTAWELEQEGVSHEIISDNAAGYLMQQGEVDLVIVGSDRTLGRTGEVANKIGTYTRAVLAHRHKIPFYVAIPLSTIDWDLENGAKIPIEERDENEVLGAWGVDPRGKRTFVRVGNPTSHARNPGFDVTPAELITGIITPQGIYRPKELWKHRRRLGFDDGRTSRITPNGGLNEA